MKPESETAVYVRVTSVCHYNWEALPYISISVGFVWLLGALMVYVVHYAKGHNSQRPKIEKYQSYEGSLSLYTYDMVKSLAKQRYSSSNTASATVVCTGGGCAGGASCAQGLAL